MPVVCVTRVQYIKTWVAKSRNRYKSIKLYTIRPTCYQLLRNIVNAILGSVTDEAVVVLLIAVGGWMYSKIRRKNKAE